MDNDACPLRSRILDDEEDGRGSGDAGAGAAGLGGSLQAHETQSDQLLRSVSRPGEVAPVETDDGV